MHFLHKMVQLILMIVSIGHIGKHICYSFEKLDGMYNFYLVAVHEIGHALGYFYKNEHHNIDDPLSIMYPIYSNWSKNNFFTEADRQAMRDIYLAGRHTGGGQFISNVI